MQIVAPPKTKELLDEARLGWEGTRGETASVSGARHGAPKRQLFMFSF
jgi:hypothetical protein